MNEDLAKKCENVQESLVAIKECHIWKFLKYFWSIDKWCFFRKIIRYSRSTINAYFLLLYEWWVPS